LILPEPWVWVLLPLAGFAAGIVNTLAGGGSFLTLPALMAAGLPVHVANGTNRIGILLQSLVAGRLFHRRGLVDAVQLGRLLPVSIAGAAAGVAAAALMPPAWLERVFGMIFLAAGALMLARPRSLLAPRPATRVPGLEALVFLGIGFYAGLIQAGAGVLILSAMALLSGSGLMAGNGIKLGLNVIFQGVALVGFAAAGQVRPVEGLLLAAGAVGGAVAGSHLAFWKGSRLIYAALVVVVLATGLRMVV